MFMINFVVFPFRKDNEWELSTCLVAAPGNDEIISENNEITSNVH